jgi:hypothetical protein
LGELRAHGVAIEVPGGWDGRISRRPEHGEIRAAGADGPAAAPGFTTRAVTHISSRPLPVDPADFGSNVVEGLGPDDAFVVLLEFDPASAGTPLFAAQGLPRALDPERFSPTMLQRTIPGQAGLQVFFTERGRALCLYVVIGAYSRRHAIVPKVNAVLATLRVEPVDGASE